MVLTLAALMAGMTLLSSLAPARLSAQDNVLDLRLLEINSKGNITYQNFIYARMLDSAQWLIQGLYLRESSINYSEVAVGAGYRVASAGGFSGYVIAGLGNGNAGPGADANYFEPAFYVSGTQGKWTGSAFLQRYVDLDSKGVNGWLVDPLEAAYNFAGPFTAGISIYEYQPVVGPQTTKLGIKFGVNDKLGTSEVRISNVNTTGQAATAEFQFRRIFVF
jgi:hypothetical protein